MVNRLAQAHLKRAHALLVAREGGYTVSVRAPVERPTGAEALCREFETGGGREAAAGINLLPEWELERFIEAFERAYRAT